MSLTHQTEELLGHGHWQNVEKYCYLLCGVALFYWIKFAWYDQYMPRYTLAEDIGTGIPIDKVSEVDPQTINLDTLSMDSSCLLIDSWSVMAAVS